jgi:hypothetical protein
MYHEYYPSLRPCVTFSNKRFSYGEELLASPQPQTGDHPLSAICDCLSTMFHYVRCYPPYPEAVPSIRNLRTCHAGVTRDPLNEERFNFYSSSYTIRMIKLRRIRWVGHVACTGEPRNGYMILVGKPEGKRPLGKHTRRWEDNIKWILEK